MRPLLFLSQRLQLQKAVLERIPKLENAAFRMSLGERNAKTMIGMQKTFVTGGSVIAATICSLLVGSVFAQAANRSLVDLREDLARHYVEPNAHMSLAKYFHDEGNRLQAFLLLEYARRGLFPPDQFSEAFGVTFLHQEKFDNSDNAEADLLEQIGKDSQSADLAVKLADIYISREDWPNAKRLLTKAIELSPEDFANVQALAEVERRQGESADTDLTVEKYLNKFPQSKPAFSRRIDPLMREHSQAAEKLLGEALAKFPDEGQFHFNLGVVLQNQDRIEEAEREFVKAALLAANSAHIQGWTGRFFLKVKEDKGKALEYYLNAYFLDPNFYDSEFAEQRIFAIGSQLAQQRFEALTKEGKRPVDIVRDQNPLVVGIALDELGRAWDPRNVDAVVEALGHDDEYVRARALKALTANADDSIDDKVKSLLHDNDQRKQGMAGYLAVKRWGDKGVETVVPWLSTDVQLLKFDAISALLQYGDEKGQELVEEQRRKEKQPWFKMWLDALVKQQDAKESSVESNSAIGVHESTLR